MGRRVYVTNEITGMTVMLLDLTLEQAARWKWLVAHEYIHGPLLPEKAPWHKAPEAIAQEDGTYRCGNLIAALVPPPRPDKHPSTPANHREAYHDPFDEAVDPDDDEPQGLNLFDEDNDAEFAVEEAQPQPVPIPAPGEPGPERLRDILNGLFAPRRGG